MRPLLAVLVVLAFGTVAVATATAGTSSKGPVDAVKIAPQATADPSDTARVEVGRAMGSSPGQGRGISPAVRGLLLPVDGAEITTSPELLPNSAREYRAGWHEGAFFRS